MTFLAPVWLALAAAVSAGVVAIHFIAWRLPRNVTLPTARFVPDEPARRASRTLRLADVGLLALRVTIIMAGGLALARPTFSVAPSGTATVFAIERSAMIGDSAAVRDSVRGRQAANPSYVVFDTAAAVFQDEAEAWNHLGRVAANQRASLNVGLLAATREARRLIRDYETVNIVLVSTFTRDLFDDATIGVRGTWGDSVQIMRIAPAVEALEPARVDVQSVGDDPVAAGIRLAISHGMVQRTARVVRGVATAADSAWATAGRALVTWPRGPTGTERVDGVRAGDVTSIAHFIRPVPAPDSGHVIARWVDGSAAAHESPLGTGCIRTIGFDVPDAGDYTLTPAFQRLAAALVAPCGGSRSSDVVADSVILGLAAPSGTPTSAILPDEAHAPNRLAGVIMILAIMLAGAELVVRRRGRSGDTVVLEPAA